jgi:hypothetical protein
MILAPIESSNPNSRYDEWLDMLAMGSEYDHDRCGEVRRTGRVTDVPLCNEGRRCTGLPFKCRVQPDRSFRRSRRDCRERGVAVFGARVVL